MRAGFSRAGEGNWRVVGVAGVTGAVGVAESVGSD